MHTLEANDFLPFLFKIARENLVHVLTEDPGTENLFKMLLEKTKEVGYDVFLREFKCVLFHKNQYQYSWLFSQGIEHDYLILDVLQEFCSRGLLDDDLFVECILHEEPLIPFDFKGKLTALFVKMIKKEKVNFKQTSFLKLETFLINFTALPRRTIEEKLNIVTDGIDHLFPIPQNLEDKLFLLNQAALYKENESRFKDVIYLLDKIQPFVSKDIQLGIHELKASTLIKDALFTLSTLTKGSWISERVKSLIEVDVDCSFRTWIDYVVCWDQEVANFNGYTYTTSELFKICLTTSELSSPDLLIRTQILKFYRGMLKISGRASIGLKAAIYYGEHGIIENPTFFYMGRDCIIGKGCIIDPVGGLVMLSKSYIGGGFIPILIHTHKHILAEGNVGTDERNNIVPCVLVAKKGARFPMNHSLLFEAADYINRETPYPGIEVFKVELPKQS